MSRFPKSAILNPRLEFQKIAKINSRVIMSIRKSYYEPKWNLMWLFLALFQLDFFFIYSFKETLELSQPPMKTML